MIMRKFIWGLILVVGAISVYFAWGAKGTEERKVVVHDTIYKDTFLVTLRDTALGCISVWSSHKN